jgi:hypothetical protein
MKRYITISIFLGTVQLMYFILSELAIDWYAVSDPIANMVQHYIILPSSFFSFLIAPVYGSLYLKPRYHNTIKVTLLVNVILSLLSAIIMYFTMIISILEIPKYALIILIIISPFSLVLMLVMNQCLSRRVAPATCCRGAKHKRQTE